jgi:hypothetical protein
MGFVDGHAKGTQVLKFRGAKAPETPYACPDLNLGSDSTAAAVESMAAKQRYY